MKTALQKMRKKAGFRSAAAFAEHMGLNVYSYTDYEQGRTGLSLAVAWELADALGCSLDELAGREWPRAQEAPSRDEEELLDAYRSTDERGRRAIMAVAASQAGDSGLPSTFDADVTA